MKNVALIMAAGTSRRCGFDKLIAELGNQTVLQRCLQTFNQCDAIDEIWVVGREVPAEGKIRGSIPGGNSRFQSVRAGLQHCADFYDEDARIIVHNAANPWLSETDLSAGLSQAKIKPNLIFGFFSPNSIKQVSEDGLVNNFLDREQIFETQTPQVSKLSTFKKALEVYSTGDSRIHEDEEPRDEAELLALIDKPIHVYECDPSNTKITYASDIAPPLAYGHLPLSQGENIRLGIGEDSHRFAPKFLPEKPFRLGGVDVSEGRLSSDGNSDGDVILHALCNALLNAYGDTTFDPIAAPICAKGDTHSARYLQATLEHLHTRHSTLDISQVLISLEGAQPRIAPQHKAIQSNVAKLLNLEPSQVGLTYTTGEGLSDFGKGLGMRSYVLVTLKNSL